jgi:hypothetical protein
VTYPVFLGAIVLTSSNNRLRFREGAGAVTNVDLTPGTYYLRETSIGVELENAIFAALGANTYAVGITYDIDPANAGVTLSINRLTGAATFQLVVDGSETFDYALIGFTSSTANDATAKTSTVSCAGAWVGNDIFREREPFGTRTVSVPRKANGGVVGVSRTAHMTSWALSLAFIHEDRMLLKVNTSDPNATLEAFIKRFGAGAAFEAYEVAISSGTVLAAPSGAFAILHWSEESLGSFRPRRIGPGVPLYDIDMVAHEQVTS